VISLPAADAPNDRATVITIVGAAGEEEFGSNFSRQAEAWKKACDQSGAQLIAIGSDETPTPTAAGAATDYERLKSAIESEPKDSLGQLWIVLIGHGTFDGKEPKFNLRGPDVSAVELAAWLKPFKRPVALIDTSSASAPFLNQLTGKNRVVITATRSGYEQNFTRFGEYLAEAVTSADSDLDKDGQTSLLEAFLSASYRVTDFYKTENRLATEHALIDDNGDGLGTPAEWFRGIRATKQAKDGASLDGLRAHQFILVRSAAEQKLSLEMRARRDDLELSIARLREEKSKLKEDEYYRQLEALMLQLAELYRPGT
jgi:hypothetical protein